MSRKYTHILWILTAIIGIPALLLIPDPIEAIHWIGVVLLAIKGVFRGFKLYQGTV